VGYFDATADGKPVGPENVVTATCVMFSGNPPEAVPELSVRTRELNVLVGQTATQVVTVRNPKDATPKMALAYPSTVVAADDPDAPRVAAHTADLKTALEGVLTRAPAKDASTPLAHEFRWALDIRLPDAVKVAIQDIEGGLNVP